MAWKAGAVLLLLVAAVTAGNQVRYSNQAITNKLFELRELAPVGGSPATVMKSHGTKVKVEFSVQQPTPNKFVNKMTYHLQNTDGSWKQIVVDYECREFNMKKLCYGKTCPIAQSKPVTVPKSIKDCLETAQQASEVLKYMLLNNPELIKNAQGLKDCMKDKTKDEKDVDKICFNNAISDIDKAVAELREEGYELQKNTDGSQTWIKVIQATK